MPIVEVKWLKGRDKAMKTKVAQKIENIMQEDVGCKPGDTYVVFSDVERESWAKEGILYADR